MATIGAYEAKTRFSQLIERVTRGERITITRHGVPVALLCPVTPSPSRTVQEVIAEIKAHRLGNRLDGISVRELIDEGRS